MPRTFQFFLSSPRKEDNCFCILAHLQYWWSLCTNFIWSETCVQYVKCLVRSGEFVFKAVAEHIKLFSLLQLRFYTSLDAKQRSLATPFSWCNLLWLVMVKACLSCFSSSALTIGSMHYISIVLARPKGQIGHLKDVHWLFCVRCTKCMNWTHNKEAMCVYYFVFWTRFYSVGVS